MSLNWNAADCPAMQKVWEWDAANGGFDNLTNEQHDERRALFAVDFARLDDTIWASIMVEAGGITENSIDTWVKRLYMGMRMRLWSAVLYPDNTDSDRDFLATSAAPFVDDVHERVSGFMGLTVNVAAITDAAWWKKNRRMMEQDAQRGLNKIARQEAAA